MIIKNEFSFFDFIINKKENLNSHKIDIILSPLKSIYYYIHGFIYYSIYDSIITLYSKNYSYKVYKYIRIYDKVKF